MVNCPDCGFQNIPGVDECEKCGQSLTDLSELEPSSLLEEGLIEDKIATLRPRQPLSVTPSTPVGDVLDLLVENSVGCALIMEGDELIGIFSERDALVRLNVEAANLKSRPVSEFMTPAPGTLGMEDSIAFAVHKMALGGYRHVPILVAGRVEGIISIRDVLKYATDKLLASES